MSPFTAKCNGAVKGERRLAVVAAIISCLCGMVGRGEANNGSSNADTIGSVAWLLEAMVACIVFYDRAHERGTVFTSRDVPIKKCITCIKRHGAESGSQLLSSIRYSTLHFSEAPASIQAAVEAE